MTATELQSPGAANNPETDRSPDIWWNGRRQVNGKTVHDPLTIRDQNGLIVKICATAKEARNLIRANNKAEWIRTRS